METHGRGAAKNSIARATAATVSHAAVNHRCVLVRGEPRRSETAYRVARQSPQGRSFSPQTSGKQVMPAADAIQIAKDATATRRRAYVHEIEPPAEEQAPMPDAY